ncbi:MAG: DUF6249 domain-containing protein [Petrimonas sp.]|uniref:DUF6249 domain-containing protein n=1 Tax=Petrimonas sp. TaxID=2023866 RepID=UPI000960BE9A|nr:DUF6249 domain-containing protein [Petrimonas sp.]MEA5044527.1 DUF6249 domain-containing protein [Petrimonas sp.]MEA5062378.1 DUF6249 domain-containing protein [Petrimonas sp.]OJV32585.1 MAG: hypothetical protein BGO33_09250 [Bacteroidia bacterium 43-41]
MEELWVPIIAILCTIGLPIGFGMYLGLTSIRAEHKERMDLIRQGIIPPERIKKKANPNRLVSLRNGIVLIALGIGIIVGFLCSEYLTIGQDNEFWIIGASVVFFLGLGFLAYFLVTQKMPLAQQKEETDQE